MKNKRCIDFADIQWKREGWGDGIHAWVPLPNGWEVSVVKSKYSYGNQRGEGLYEAAALQGGHLVQLPGESDQVVGWLDKAGVEAFIDRVAAIKPWTLPLAKFKMWCRRKVARR